MTNPRIRTGALVGALLTAPLMAVLYLAGQVAGLPFSPFDFFNWLARVLPGNVITLGIDTIVTLINSLQLGETSSTAKLMEQLLALGMFLGLGIIAGWGLFAILRNRPVGSGVSVGGGLGLISGALMVLLFSAVNQTATAGPIFSALWLLVVFVGWGSLMGWIYEKLRQPVPQEAAPALATDDVERATAGPPVSTGVINRRQFLMRVGNAAALITVTGAGLGALLEAGSETALVPSSDAGLSGAEAGLPSALPNAGAAVMPAPGTRPEYTPMDDYYRIDISLVPPRIEGETWMLPITGLVDNPLMLTLDDLRENYPAMEQYITMSCISNQVAGDLIGTTHWTGASLQQVLADAGLQEDAAYLRVTSEDGFHETVALDLINSDERIMLCYAWDNEPLTGEHGFPLRIYIPDRYGMKQPKWITNIEVISQYEEGYWVRRGWDEVARVKTTSVIDTVAANALVEDDGQLRVPVGGIAYAGARGISQVEVRVDDGEWQAAELRTPLSDTTWVVWRYDWPFEAGEHTFSVRAYDGDGVVQDDAVRGSRPSGATGIHSRSASLTEPVEAS